MKEVRNVWVIDLATFCHMVDAHHTQVVPLGNRRTFTACLAGRFESKVLYAIMWKYFHFLSSFAELRVDRWRRSPMMFRHL